MKLKNQIFTKLPSDIINYIIKHLPFEDKLQFRLVNRSVSNYDIKLSKMFIMKERFIEGSNPPVKYRPEFLKMLEYVYYDIPYNYFLTFMINCRKIIFSQKFYATINNLPDSIIYLAFNEAYYENPYANKKEDRKISIDQGISLSKYNYPIWKYPSSLQIIRFPPSFNQNIDNLFKCDNIWKVYLGSGNKNEIMKFDKDINAFPKKKCHIYFRSLYANLHNMQCNSNLTAHVPFGNSKSSGHIIQY